MRVPFFGSSYFSANTARYIGIGEADASEPKISIPVPLSGSIGGLQVRTSVAPQGVNGTRSYAFEIYVNGATTGVACSIVQAAVACSDPSNTVNVNAGDRVALRAQPTNNPTTSSVTWSFYIQQ